jgi:murein DD-endopeptidase MepM/ murein hydrolase activator NlpD
LSGARALALAACAILAGCPRPPYRTPPAPPPADAPPPPVDPGRPHVELDVAGVVHVVKKGETLYRIARAYGLTPEDLAEVNGVRDPRALEVGDELFVPGATRLAQVPPPSGPEPEPAPATPVRDGAPPRLAWPLKGVLYSKFGPRQGQHHDGVDIAAPRGTPILAAADGRVVYAGEQSGYGSLVILRHGGGLLTVYAHASELLVREGEEVRAGTPVARVGQSGRTTGPHLHFEVREGTRARDPLSYLRPAP